MDLRVISNVVQQTFTSYPHSQSEVGGWPVLNTYNVPTDTDRDGMPDYWETAVGLNPNVANNNQVNASGYTELEEYLNWLADLHAVGAGNSFVDMNLRTFTAGMASNATYTVANATNGTVTLLDDGRTARFTPAPQFFGRASFVFASTDALAGGGMTNAVNLLITLPLGPVRACGDNSLGQLNVPFMMTNVIAIASGAWHSLALKADGTVLTWGNDWQGQCDVPAGLSGVLAIAAGGYHSLAIRTDGTAVSWGNDDYGQSQVPTGLGRVLAIGAGTWHSLALRLDGTVVAWGDNSLGQCSVPFGLNDVVAIAAGGNHSLALKADGGVVGWGENTDAQGVYAGQSVVPFGLSNVVAIAAGDYHSLALRKDGSVLAWGDNSQGQREVPAGLGNVVAVVGGGAHSLALEADGRVVAWGANWSGQCDLPAALGDAVGMAAGEEHTLVLVAGSVPEPRMLNAGWGEGRFSAVAQTLNRRSYALDYKDWLGAATWTALSTNAGNGALKLLSDPTASAPQRFYRLRQW